MNHDGPMGSSGCHRYQFDLWSVARRTQLKMCRTGWYGKTKKVFIDKQMTLSRTLYYKVLRSIEHGSRWGGGASAPPPFLVVSEKFFWLTVCEIFGTLGFLLDLKDSLWCLPNLADSLRFLPDLADNLRFLPDLADSLRWLPNLADSLRWLPNLADSLRFL